MRFCIAVHYTAPVTCGGRMNRPPTFAVGVSGIPERRGTRWSGKAPEMTDSQTKTWRAAILAEYADEEAEAAEVEIAQSAAALEVPLNLRITKALDAQLRQRAAADQIPTSALVRRLLTHGLHDQSTRSVLTVEQVEEIARRVALETTSGR